MKRCTWQRWTAKIAWWWLKAVRRRRLTPQNSRFDRERRQAFNLRQAEADAKETATALMAVGCCSRSNWLFDRDEKSCTGKRCSPLDSKHPPGLKGLNRTPGDSGANWREVVVESAS
jgi:hypothetical protein